MNENLIPAILFTAAFIAVLIGLPIAVAWARKSPDLKTIAKLAPLSILSFALWFALIIWGWSGKRDDNGVISRSIEAIKQRNLLPWIVGGLVLAGVASAGAMMLF